MDETIKTLKETINSKLNRYTTFSDNFHLFIREQIGISHLYDIGDPSQKGYVGPSFEERLAKVNLMLERAEFEDDKLSPNEQALSKFSSEALDLRIIVQKIGPQKDVCNDLYLSRFFKTLNFQSMEIEQIDSWVQSFTNLQVLNLAHNKVQSISYLPPNLKELSLTHNKVDSIATSIKSTSLIHLGLGYNFVNSQALTKICVSFPNLFSLDLSFNNLSVFESLLVDLQKLQFLKMINTKGNSVCLNKDYRAILKQTFPLLSTLDGIPAFSEAEEAAKKKRKVKFDAYGNAVVDQSSLIQVKKGVSIELQFRLMQNCQGVYLSQESACNYEQLDMSQIPPEKKSSTFSLRFRNPENQLVNSNVKVWINDFQVDKDASNVGKTDFNFVTKMEFKDENLFKLKEWLMQDLFVELYHTKPVMKEKIAEDGSIQQEVVLGSDGQPQTEETLIGVMRLELSNLLLNSDPTKEEIDSHRKIPFFDPKWLDRPEFRIRNRLIALKDQDIVLLNEALKTVEEEHSKLATQQKQTNAPAPVSKDSKKPDPKKDAKGKPAAKGTVPTDDPNSPKDIVIDYPEVPSLPDYVIIDRSYHKMKESVKPIATVSKASKAPADSSVDKKAVRLQELQDSYEIIRSKPITCATIVRLNYSEPQIAVEDLLKLSDSQQSIKPPTQTPVKNAVRKK